MLFWILVGLMVVAGFAISEFAEEKGTFAFGRLLSLLGLIGVVLGFCKVTYTYLFGV